MKVWYDGGPAKVLLVISECHMQTTVSFFGTVYVVFSPLWSATMHVQTTITTITCFDNWKKKCVNVIIMSSLFCHSWAHSRPFICKGDPPSEMLLPLEKQNKKKWLLLRNMCVVVVSFDANWVIWIQSLIFLFQTYFPEWPSETEA